MKSSLVLLFIAVCSSGLAQNIPDHMHSPRASFTQMVGMTKIEIDYSRPSLKGRDLFKELIIEGMEWRTGANEATTISFDDPVVINGSKVKAGKYAIYTVPEKGKWEIIINADYEKDSWAGRDKSKDVLSMLIPTKELEVSVETFTILVTDLHKNHREANVKLSWGKYSVKFPVEVPKKWVD